MVSIKKRAKSSKPIPVNYFPFIARLFSGTGKCSTPIVVWILIGFLLMLHLCTLTPHTDTHSKEIVDNTITNHHRSRLRELEVIEEENIQMPPSRKRSPLAVKRKPKNRNNNLMDEFFDKSSSIRHVFFPTMKTAIDLIKDVGNDPFFFSPGSIWLDTEGNPIQAHERSRKYYWYGEYKDGPTYHAHKKGATRVNSDS